MELCVIFTKYPVLDFILKVRSIYKTFNLPACSVCTKFSEVIGLKFTMIKIRKQLIAISCGCKINMLPKLLNSQVAEFETK